MILIVTLSGLSLEQGILTILRKVAYELEHNSGSKINAALLETTKSHIAGRYPGSKHYDPNKVTYGRSAGNLGQINIDIPGISKAYHDMNILPKYAKHLTIPMHLSAYGKKVSDFNDLFKPKGKNALARIDESGHLVWMFALAKKAFLKQDRSLMPQDSTYSDNIFKAISTNLDLHMQHFINNL